MTVENRSTVGKLDQQRYHHKQRAESNQTSQRTGNIEAALDEAADRRRKVGVRLRKVRRGRLGNIPHAETPCVERMVHHKDTKKMLQRNTQFPGPLK